MLTQLDKKLQTSYSGTLPDASAHKNIPPNLFPNFRPEQIREDLTMKGLEAVLVTMLLHNPIRKIENLDYTGGLRCPARITLDQIIHYINSGCET